MPRNLGPGLLHTSLGFPINFLPCFFLAGVPCQYNYGPFLRVCNGHCCAADVLNFVADHAPVGHTYRPSHFRSWYLYSDLGPTSSSRVWAFFELSGTLRAMYALLVTAAVDVAALVCTPVAPSTYFFQTPGRTAGPSRLDCFSSCSRFFMFRRPWSIFFLLRRCCAVMGAVSVSTSASSGGKLTGSWLGDDSGVDSGVVKGDGEKRSSAKYSSSLATLSCIPETRLNDGESTSIKSPFQFSMVCQK